MRDTPMSCRGEDQGEAHDARVVLTIKCKLRVFGAGTFHAGLVGDGEQTHKVTAILSLQAASLKPEQVSKCGDKGLGGSREQDGPFWGILVFLAFGQMTNTCSVIKSCLKLCNPIDCSTPGLPVPHYLPEFAQVHVQ